MGWEYTSAIAYAQPIIVKEYQSGYRCLDHPFDILGYDDVNESTLEGELKDAATTLLGEGHGITIKYFQMKYQLGVAHEQSSTRITVLGFKRLFRGAKCSCITPSHISTESPSEKETA